MERSGVPGTFETEDPGERMPIRESEERTVSGLEKRRVTRLVCTSTGVPT